MTPELKAQRLSAGPFFGTIGVPKMRDNDDRKTGHSMLDRLVDRMRLERAAEVNQAETKPVADDDAPSPPHSPS